MKYKRAVHLIKIQKSSMEEENSGDPQTVVSENSQAEETAAHNEVGENGQETGQCVDSDQEESGLLQPGEALTGGADDDGQTRIISLEENEEDEFEEEEEEVGEAPSEATEEEVDKENQEDDSSSKAPVSADNMQLPEQSLQSQSVSPMEEDDESQQTEATPTPSKRAILSPEKLAAARKAAASAFGFDDPEPAPEPTAGDETEETEVSQSQKGQKQTTDGEKEEKNQPKENVAGSPKRRGRPPKAKPQEEPQQQPSTSAKRSGNKAAETAASKPVEETTDVAVEEVTPRRRSRMPKRYLDDEPEPKQKEDKKTPATSVEKKGRGRPRKDPASEGKDKVTPQNSHESNSQEVKRGRGRPRKVDVQSTPTPQRGRGRPRKDVNVSLDAEPQMEEDSIEEAEEEVPVLAEASKSQRSGRAKKNASEDNSKSKQVNDGDSSGNSPRVLRRSGAQDEEKTKGKGSKPDDSAVSQRRGRSRSQQGESEDAQPGSESDNQDRQSKKRARDEDLLPASPATPRKKPRSQAEVQIVPSGMARVKDEPAEKESQQEDKGEDTPMSATVAPEPGTPAAPTVHVVASQSITLVGEPTTNHIAVSQDSYTFEELDASTDLSQVVATSIDESSYVTEISTQTAGEELVEFETILETADQRSVQTQTDPRLKKKKFGPLSHDMECDTMDLEDEDDEYEYRRRRRYEDDISLFEDSGPRRKSIKRNTEEALKCPYCDKAFIGLVKHIKGKHSDEVDFEEEMRNAKWRERIMKVSTAGSEEGGDTCPDCGKVSFFFPFVVHMDTFV